MAQAATQLRAADRLLGLVGRLGEQEDFAGVVASLKEGDAATLGGVWGSSCALVAAALAEHCAGPVVVVFPHPGDVDGFVDDAALFTARGVATFPAWESEPAEAVVHDEVFGDRLRLLKQLSAAGYPELIATSIQSLLQPVPARQTLKRQTRTLRRGDEIAVEELARWLVERGFHNTSAVELPGEFSLRGGILDVFAPDWLDPVRIELFGDQIDSLRAFDVAAQRSRGAVDEINITMLTPGAGAREHFAAYLPPETWFLLVEPPALEEEGRHYLQSLEAPDAAYTTSAVLKESFRFPSVTASGVAQGSFDTSCDLKIESVERFSGDIARVRDELEQAAGDQQVFVVCESEAEAHRLGEVFAETAPAREGRLHFPIGRLRAGFRLVADGAVLISGEELFRRESPRRAPSRRLGRAIDSFLDLRQGDLVIHVSHGLARFRGMHLLEQGDQVGEHLELEFHGGTKIYVPAERIELVQKYVGGGRTRPQLARIGGRSWVRQKEAAQRAVTDMAAEMLELQATRAARPGISFPLTSEWQREFEAAFAYTETPDQWTAAEAIRSDMHRRQPMDRLICGDVGYGKTELAMRAAFKAVDAGYQAAVLVPTTVLAMQHLRTFTSRMAEYPYRIAALSRFCTTKEQKEILAGLADGSVDIVVGTHRLAQSDVHFHNLGLIVIDEEQRFGVAVKERLKTYRQIVDVLTMTATPIPRTLHMSLLGVRDISNLETPPADRLAVETRVVRFDADMIRHAVLRELGREGQLFFVHNRVQDIHAVATRLRQVVPEARIEIGHGQMPEGALEQVMLDFVAHKFDVLLATTIVESGLDIPNANTIFINEADRYGLADMHQLRGRVGRYKHRAYCYLLVDPGKSLTPTAAKRLRAIEEFSDMGVGFAIAMRDLEVRGAGNILGTEQSGHIAAVGYELYCELLEKAVAQLKNTTPRTSLDVNIDLPCAAYIPRKYVPDQRSKIDLYRRLARLAGQAELNELAAELVDRFGPRPPEVERLLELAEVRIMAAGWRIHAIHLEDGYAVFRYASRPDIQRLAALSDRPLRIVDERSAYLPLQKPVTDADQILAQIKSLLRRPR